MVIVQAWFLFIDAADILDIGGDSNIDNNLKIKKMIFGNNIEAMGFEKSGWQAIATSEQVTYMGKPLTPDATADEPVWIVKKIEHPTDTGKDGLQYITTKYSRPNVKWSEKESLEYKYFWP